MKKTLPLAFAFALLALAGPSSASAAALKVTSPAGGELFGLGETLGITWEPTSKGIETITLVSARANGPSLGLYGAKVYGDPVNYDGEFSYELPDYLVIPAGKYRVRLDPVGNGRNVESRTFTFVSEEAAKAIKPKYKFGKVTGIEKKGYVAGSPVRFDIQAFEVAKVPATPENGFNVQAHLYDQADRNRALQAVNATYNAERKVWSVEFVAPEEADRYIVVTSLYCGNLAAGSYCAQKYTDSQVIKQLKFAVR